MNALLKTYRNSRIAKKLTNRILVIEISIFVLIVALSFFTLSPLLRKQVIDKAADVNSQMANKVSITAVALAESLHYIATARELQEVLDNYNRQADERNYRAVCLTLNRMTQSRSNVRCVVLENENACFNSINDITSDDRELLESDWYENIKNSAYSQRYTVIYSEETRTNTFVYAKNCYIGAETYTVTLYYNANSLIDEIQRLSRNTFTGFCIIGRELDIPYTSGSISLPNNIAFPSDFSERLSSANGIYFMDIVHANMWYIISFAENSSISMSYRGYMMAAIALFIILSALTILLITPAIYQIINPVNTLSKTMQKVAAGDLALFSEFEADDEIGDLSRAFNKMVVDFKKYIGKLIEQEQVAEKMKYSLLISQIDPHFIYNTMSIINSLARNGQNEDIVVINNALITILQDRLRVNAIEVFDTVRQEVDILRKYLLIQDRRYENKAIISWDIEDELLDRYIPKNIIQPLVENALFHGLFDEEIGGISGNVNISVKSYENGLVVEVSDNGKGISSEQIDWLISDLPSGERGRHIGLRNIRERLEFLYGSENCMTITSNGGTTVTLRLREL